MANELAHTEVQWLHFSVDPDHDRYGTGMAGRKLHAVYADDEESCEDIALRRSVCGRWPKHGWTLDIFNDPEDQCSLCLRKLGLACSVCGGTGWVKTRKAKREGLTHGWCAACAGSGTAKGQAEIEALRAELESP